MLINKNEITKLKGEGFLKQNQGDYFSVRIISTSGNFTSEQINHMSHIAGTYGKGYMGVTTRLCMEIPWIKFEDIDKVKEELKSHNLRYGGTGKKVRPIVSCKGTVCTHGIIDTQGLCKELHDKYFAMDLPSKFKIGIVGCPNNCAKASLNDLGIMGSIEHDFNKSKCISCGLCTKVCKEGALYKDVNGVVNYDQTKCVHCGECITQCKFSALTKKAEGVHIFIGGRFGRRFKIGEKLNNLYSIEEAKEMCNKIIEYYKEKGEPDERFSKTIDRIGLNEVKKALNLSLS